MNGEQKHIGTKFPFPKNERGAILIITVLIIAALTALTLAFSEESRVELNLAQFSRETLQARQMAVAGFNLLLTEISKIPEDKIKEWEENKRDWSQFAPLTFPDPLPDGITVEARYLDESGKININFLSKRLKDKAEAEASGSPTDKIDGDIEQMKTQLGRLFTTLGIEEPASLVDPLIDWLDKGHDPELNGAEEDYYQGLPNPYPCADGPLLTIDQIYLVKGFGDLKLNDENGEKKITDFLTIYGDDLGRININAAPKEVLLSLNENINADAVIEYRQENGEIDVPKFLDLCGIADNSLLKNKIIDSKTTNTYPCYLIEIKVKVQEAEISLKAVVAIKIDKNTKKKNQEIIYWRII
jgi:general secretion pathway protein K